MHIAMPNLEKRSAAVFPASTCALRLEGTRVLSARAETPGSVEKSKDSFSVI